MNISISAVIIPFIIAIVALLSLLPKKNYFNGFLEGAKDGAVTCFNLLPTMAGLMVALSMLSASGAVDWLANILSPIGDAVGIPAELLPLLITRPFSGSASNATFMELVGKYGADSFPALCAAVVMGSSDTLVYVISVYFSTTKVKKTRHAVPSAVIVMVFCVFISCFLCRLIFG